MNPDNNASTPPPTNNPEANLFSPDKQSNSLSSKDTSSNNTSSVSSRLDYMESLVSNTIINLLSPDEEENEAHYKTRSLERHAQEFSDTGNTHRFVSQHHTTLRYIPLLDRWMTWNGKRWSVDTNDNILAFARDTIQSLRDEALALPYEQRQRSTQLFDHADHSDTPARLHAMLNLARQDLTLVATPHTFDSDPFLLNVLNGTINLRTGKL